MYHWQGKAYAIVPLIAAIKQLYPNVGVTFGRHTMFVSLTNGRVLRFQRKYDRNGDSVINSLAS